MGSRSEPARDGLAERTGAGWARGANRRGIVTRSEPARDRHADWDAVRSICLPAKAGQRDEPPTPVVGGHAQEIADTDSISDFEPAMPTISESTSEA